MTIDEDVAQGVGLFHEGGRIVAAALGVVAGARLGRTVHFDLLDEETWNGAPAAQRVPNSWFISSGSSRCTSQR